jgi:hypothetical protein
MSGDVERSCSRTQVDQPQNLVIAVGWVASSKRIPVKEARNCWRRCKYVRHGVHVGAGARQLMNPLRRAAFEDLRRSATTWKHVCGAARCRAGIRSATRARRAGKYRRSRNRSKDREPHEISTPLVTRGCQAWEAPSYSSRISEPRIRIWFALR